MKASIFTLKEQLYFADVPSPMVTSAGWDAPSAAAGGAATSTETAPEPTSALIINAAALPHWRMRRFCQVAESNLLVTR